MPAFDRFFMAMMCDLETDNLRLRPCRADDTALLHALWTDEHVRHFLFDERTISHDEARSFVESSQKDFAHFGYGLWLASARVGCHFVGFAGLLRVAADEAPNLIYGINPQYWGHGYAAEAASAVLRYGLTELGLPRVKADVDAPNAASVRVLAKLGMARVGEAVVEGKRLLYYELRAQPGGAI